MWSASIAIVLISCSLIPARGQNLRSQGCSVSTQYDPVLVSNPNSEVTFECRDSTALDLIESTGRQTRKPIGIVLGEDPTLLSKTKRSYRLFHVDTKSALMAAVAGTGYSVNESDLGFVLIAGDLTSRQRKVLTREYSDFHGGSNATMVALGWQLTIWMESDIDHPTTFMASILGSTDDEKFTLGAIPPSTVAAIADRIVSLGSKGMWILTIDPFQRTSEWTDDVKIEPYQHYSNFPVTDY